jgi:hypothetical protein
MTETQELRVSRLTLSSECRADAMSTHYIGDEVRLARGNLADGFRFRKRPPALLTTLLTLGSMYAD